MNDTLTVADRCDRCTAQAMVRWTATEKLRDDGTAYLPTIDLCGHHSTRNGADMLAQGFSVRQDVTASINAAPSPSATV